MTGLTGDDSDDYYLNLNQDEESLLRPDTALVRGAPHRQGSLVRPERSRLNNPDNPAFLLCAEDTGTDEPFECAAIEHWCRSECGRSRRLAALQRIGEKQSQQPRNGWLPITRNEHY